MLSRSNDGKRTAKVIIKQKCTPYQVFNLETRLKKRWIKTKENIQRYYKSYYLPAKISLKVSVITSLSNLKHASPSFALILFSIIILTSHLVCVNFVLNDYSLISHLSHLSCLQYHLSRSAAIYQNIKMKLSIAEHLI